MTTGFYLQNQYQSAGVCPVWFIVLLIVLHTIDTDQVILSANENY
jgi:hypothetical protein